ncbi:MAG: glycosyltransferase family 4 protein [Candidatus Dormiibacterota bacterium]
MPRVLIVANDIVAERMAGPGIRCIELAAQLQVAGHEVMIAGGGGQGPQNGSLAFVASPTPNEMESLALQHDAILVQGFALRAYPALKDLGLPVIVDLYDPFPLALLEQDAYLGVTERTARSERVQEILDEQLTAGDYFICASERQRDLWIGALTAVGRVNPQTWSHDNSLRSLIDVVPFGLPDSPPGPLVQRPPGFPTVLTDADLILLWAGGIYNWFDPLTLIEAVARVVSRDPRIKLVFMSTTHPNPGIPARMWMPQRARELASVLGLEGRHVFFNEEWIPYAQRGDWLLSADCGVSTHFNNAETRYSFRTRLLDYLWANLPIITTEGDVLADLVARQDLGWTVPSEDVDALAGAILDMASDAVRRREMQKRVESIAAGMTWARAAAPLIEFCEHLRKATDVPGVGVSRRSQRYGTRGRAHKGWSLWVLGVSSLRRQGVRSTLRAAKVWWTRRRLS